MPLEKFEIAHKLDEVGSNLAIAYVEPSDGGMREEYVFEPTAENIANFIGKRMFSVRTITITDLLDQLIVNTIGGFLDRCPDRALCLEIQQYIIPIQTGEVEPADILTLPYEEMEEYWAIKNDCN